MKAKTKKKARPSPKTYWLETLGCPKNQVDSDKLEGTLEGMGALPADSPEAADLVLVNTCAFIEESRTESLGVIEELGNRRKRGSKLVVTGCMAERYGQELASKFDIEVQLDAVAGFGIPVAPILEESGDDATSQSSDVRSTSPVQFTSKQRSLDSVPSFDLLNLPRPPAKAPWAYIKIAEGCDRKCGYCAIPSFRGAQNSRDQKAILEELKQLNIKEAVLVAQDLAAYGRDRNKKNETGSRPSMSNSKPIISLIAEVAKNVDWVRLLYVHPSDLSEDLVDAILETPVPYFDLSLQHASKPLLKKMRRFGSGDLFQKRIAEIRAKAPDAVFRSNFIIGYPGETAADHEELVEFIEEAQLDWVGCFLYSEEPGTYSAKLTSQFDEIAVPRELARERRAELQTLQLEITESKRDQLIGETLKVLVEKEGEARSFREAPEIDGVIYVPATLAVGSFQEVKIVGSSGCDLHAVSNTI